MEVITYQNIKVDGIPLKRILALTIDHSSNNHATATVLCEVDYEEGKDCISRMDETTGIAISTTAEGQPSKLFCGIVSNAKLESEGDYTTMYVELVSSSALLDIQKNKKSFQNTGKTYEQILNDALGGSGTINFAVSDKAIGNLIMQYNETNWEFTKRMAAVFNAPVIASIISKKPYLTIGLPPANRTVTIDSTKKTVAVNGLKFNSMSQNNLISGVNQADTAASGSTSYSYAFIGDNLSMNGVTQRISSVSAVLVDGILTMSYTCAKESGFAQPVTKNVQASGKMFKGTVKAVQLDKVQVHLVDVDSSYDGGGTHWFPYSTLYSSQDGSGFYCMPEVGDTVRVFFPSNNEGDAFAASSVNVSPLDNVKHKKWRVPKGKEILMTEEGLYITCKENKIFINLVDEDGISIYSEKDINILSTANINIQSNKELIMHAQNNMFIGTGESSIDITKEKIALSSENVVIN